MKLKIEDYIDRQLVKKQHVFPDKPLTKKERQKLQDLYLEDFCSEYAWRMRKSKCLAGFEYSELQENKRALDGEAFELFLYVLDTFDKAKKTHKDQTMEDFFRGFYKVRIHQTPNGSKMISAK